MTDDDDLTRALTALVHRLLRQPEDAQSRLTPFGEHVGAHLGVDPTGLSLLSDRVPPHRLVDVDIALDRLAGEDPDATLVGIRGGQERHHEDFMGLLRNHHFAFAPTGPVEFTPVATGPSTTRQTESSGVRLFRRQGIPFAVLQRGANPSSDVIERPSSSSRPIPTPPPTSSPSCTGP